MVGIVPASPYDNAIMLAADQVRLNVEERPKSQKSSRKKA